VFSMSLRTYLPYFLAFIFGIAGPISFIFYSNQYATPEQLITEKDKLTVLYKSAQSRMAKFMFMTPKKNAAYPLLKKILLLNPGDQYATQELAKMHAYYERQLRNNNISSDKRNIYNRYLNRINNLVANQ